MVQTECASQNILLADGAGHTLPAAVPIARRPDRAGLPVTMLRHSDGKVRHDGSRAANKQRCYAVAESAEDCTTHRNSTQEYVIVV